MVLVRPPMGFSGYAVTLPVHCRPAKLLQERTSEVSPLRPRLYCVWPSFFPEWMPFCRRLCGAKECRSRVFLALDAAGSFLWSGFYTGLGYIFSNELDVAFRWAQHFGTALGLAIVVPIGLYAGWRGLTLLRMIRRLRLRRISPAMLERKLKSKSKIAVLDLLDFEDETASESPEAIPGAFRVDPSRLRKSPRITVPDDVEIILYSSSGRRYRKRTSSAGIASNRR